MREALNENPMVQIGVLAVIAIAVGLLVLMRSGGGGEEPAATTASTPGITPVEESAERAGADQSVAQPAASASPSAAAAESTTTPPAQEPAIGFSPGPGLPEPIVDAYEGGKAVVLFVYRRKGIDDGFMNVFVRLLKRSGVPVASAAAVFRTNAHHVSRYSRITHGVDVNRTPALVVIKPKDITGAGIPVASVSYGFRGPLSVVQAVEDALYKGPQVPSYPE